MVLLDFRRFYDNCPQPLLNPTIPLYAPVPGCKLAKRNFPMQKQGLLDFPLGTITIWCYSKTTLLWGFLLIWRSLNKSYR